MLDQKKLSLSYLTYIREGCYDVRPTHIHVSFIVCLIWRNEQNSILLLMYTAQSSTLQRDNALNRNDCTLSHIQYSGRLSCKQQYTWVK